MRLLYRTKASSGFLSSSTVLLLVQVNVEEVAMTPIGTWLGRKIDAGIAHIEAGAPDSSFAVPRRRREQLRQAAVPALGEIVLDTARRGYELRGGLELAQGPRTIFVRHI